MRTPPFRPRQAMSAAEEYRADRDAREQQPRRFSGPPILPGWSADDGAQAYNPPSNLIRVANGAQAASVVSLLRGSDVRPEPINWLWYNWLATGKLHLLGGQPGSGKTTIAGALAAAVTRAGSFPDGSRCSVAGNVIFWSGEDDPQDTLVPRLIAAGADMEKIFFVGSVHEDAKSRDFDPAKDVSLLQEAIKKAGGAELVIVDPIVSAVVGDSHKNSETRRALQPLVSLCAEIGAALLGITHFTKGTAGREPIERINGSIAFGALARVVLVAAKKAEGGGEDDAEPPRRFLARAKSNIGPDGDGFAYELEQVELHDFAGVSASRVVWGAGIAGTARELLGEAERVEDEGGSELREAEAFLRQALVDGPVATTEIKSAAGGHAIAWRTVERAKRSLGVEALRKGEEGVKGGGRWFWRLTSHPSNLGGLDGLKRASASTPPSGGGVNDGWEEL